VNLVSERTNLGRQAGELPGVRIRRTSNERTRMSHIPLQDAQVAVSEVDEIIRELGNVA